MEELVYNALQSIFGGGLTGELSDWMKKLFEAIETLLNNNLMANVMDLFSVIGCSMLLLYFYMDLTSQASRDMITLEKLISSFIKLLFAFTILVALPDIITQLLSAGKAFFEWMADSSTANMINGTASNTVQFNFGTGTTSDFPEWNTVKNNFKDEFGGLHFIGHLGVTVSLLIPALLNFITKLAGYVVCTSNAVMLITKAIVSPIAVVQCFEDGTKSAGIKFLKSLTADAITMGIMVLVLYASSALTSSLLEPIYTGMGIITFDNLSVVVNWNTLLIIIVPRLAAIGAMLGANRIAKEVMG